MFAPDPPASQPPMPFGGPAANGIVPTANSLGGPMAQMAAPTPPKWHDVTISTKKNYSCAKVMGVPPEEFGIERNARTIKDSGYCFHEVTKRESDLIDQGYDAEQVRRLDSYTGTQTQESLKRDSVDENRNNAQGSDSANKGSRLVRVTEHYVRMDYEGNNKTRLYRVTTGGEVGDILILDGKTDIAEVDDMPFAALTPSPVTHRFFGRSIADLIMDIQRIKTALIRGALDNLYAHNNPRPEVSEQQSSDSTLDDLMKSAHGMPIRSKTGTAVQWQTIPDITASIYPALQYFDATREWRTGVTRQGQGVDPNALQNQVATIANQMADASQMRVKMIAKIFAETGIKDLFVLLHGLIRKNGQQAETVRLRNKWVDVDPRDWQERNDMVPNIGLGTGSKAQQLAGVMAIISLQKEALAAGKTNLVSDENLYNAAKHASKLAGFPNTDEFFTDPATQPPPQPQQDPKMLEIQAKAQAEQQKMAADQQHQQAKMQADMAHQQMKVQSDIELAKQKFELERQMHMLDAEIKQREHHMKVAETAIKAATTTTKTGADGTTESHVDHALIDNVLSKLQTPSPVKTHKGMKIVRDEHGRVSHTVPIE